MVVKNFLRVKYIILLLSGIIVFLIVNKLFFAASVQPSYITVRAVKENKIEKTVLADGTISALKQVSVGAQVSGQIKKLYVRLGQRIKKGELIAEIDDLTQQNNVKQTEASLQSLQAQRASKVALRRNDQLTYQRQQRLMQEKAGIAAELDQASANLESINADIKALDADIIKASIAVDAAKLDLAYTRIIAPMDGIIVAVPVEAGQTVNSVQSTPTIVKIARLDKMTVEAKISEADVIKVKRGLPVYFSIIGQPDFFYRGLTLRDIEPAPDSINSEDGAVYSSSGSTSAIYYNGLFDVDNTSGLLRIGMTAQVHIVLASAQDVVVIPASAIYFDDSDPVKGVVYVINKQKKVTRRVVIPGISNGIMTEIKVGLSEGEQVVVSGLEAIKSYSSSAPRRLKH